MLKAMDLTLRDAIAAISGDYIPNSSDPTGDYIWIDETTDPLGQNDTILFSSSITDPIVLSHGQMEIKNSVTISGLDASGQSQG